jgi:outer membrane protein assembly factor BamB
MPSHKKQTLTLVFSSVLLLAAGLQADNWPQWRGPEATGISLEKNLPSRWSATENIVWRVALAGRGTSTPVIWDDRIFLTSQIGEGPVNYRTADYPETGRPVDDKVRFVVQCFRRFDGRLLWQYELTASKDPEAVHPKHNLATPSCVTDGTFVFAWFGTGQIICLDVKGKLVWERHIGEDYSPFRLLWAHGSSPVLYKNSILLLCDHDPAAYLLALDKFTGKTFWKTDRGKGLRSYSTPLVVTSEGRDELIVNSNPRIDAYDPATGELLWYAGGHCPVPVPMPLYVDGMLYASRGYSSGPYMAIRPGGKGDVSETHVAWRIPTGAPYVSSLLYYGKLIYMATENGIVICADARTGEMIWKERIGGVFSASPVGGDGKIFLLNEAGETIVLEDGPKFTLLQRNLLGERCLASPAISQGRIFIRSDQHLFCIGK